MNLRFLIFLMILIAPLKAHAWPSESGSGVVSDNEVIVRTSLEATEVLRSGLLSLLYGETRLGGATNYSSFDSGGVLNFQNVVSSVDIVKASSNRYFVFLLPGSIEREIRVGLSADGVFTIATHENVIGRISSDGMHVRSGGNLRSSGDTNFINVSAQNVQVNNKLDVSGVTTFSGALNGLSQSKFGSGNNETWIENNGVIRYMGTARPRSTIVLTAAGANAITATKSSYTAAVSGPGYPFIFQRLVFSPASVQRAQWVFAVPDSFIGTSVNATVVWADTDGNDTNNASWDVQSVGVNNDEAIISQSFGAFGSVTDAGTASGDVLVTSQFNVPVNWASKDTAFVNIQRNSTDAADTIAHDLNALMLILEYERQNESD